MPSAMQPIHEALTEQQKEHLLALLNALIDQTAGRVLVSPYEAQPGFWFGGGNIVADGDKLWLCGRYRNEGDSRTGLEAGLRGLECVLFRSDDGGQTFEKVRSWSKADLSAHGPRVISIEGTALHRTANGDWELFISAEKEATYPFPWESYQKPGTGVWSIDRLHGPSLEALDAGALQPVLDAFDHPAYLHVKDPVVFDRPDGSTALIFCTHPFTWASSNTGVAVRPANGADFQVLDWEMATRGPAWDIAATRVTARLAIPRVGAFADLPPASVYFYDGAECLRPHEENMRAQKRPRGYSCEEIGGAFFGWDEEFPAIVRISHLQPLFVSPWGTGVSRYVDVYSSPHGLFASWQQGQDDGSQPLVGNFLPMQKVTSLLGG